MKQSDRQVIAQKILETLAGDIGSRPVGSAANRQAEVAIAEAFTATGLSVERQTFACLDWKLDSAGLWIDGRPALVRANPYCPAVDVEARLVFASTHDALAAADLAGAIAVLHGALTAEPLFPRHYPFFEVEEHQRTLDLLDAGRPAAVVCVSPMADSPAPVIEDGDFHLPSVTVPAPVEMTLRQGKKARLAVRSAVQPGYGANVIARRPGSDPRPVLVCAHFDTKPGTPGALDNAAGVAAMVAAAGSAADAHPNLSLEFVAFNGEDNYAAPGQMTYLAQASGDIRLVINLDGVGLRGGANTVAFFGAERFEAAVRQAMADCGLVEIEPWPQGDHMIFAMRGVPAIALTSDGIFGLLETVIHTPADTVGIVDPAGLIQVAGFIEQVWQAVSRMDES